MAVLTAMVIPVMIGMGAIVVTTSSLTTTRSNLQGAIDAAVLAGAVDLGGDSSQIATAQKYFAANLSRYTKFGASDVSAEFSVSDDAIVSGTATGAVKNPWGGFMGLRETLPVNASAAATGARGALCVLGLNAFDSGAFDLNGNAKFNAPTCAVQANSGSSQGMTMEGQPTAKAKNFGVSGGHTGNTYSPKPIDGTAKIADPYASLAFPSYDYCSGHDNTQQIKSDTTLLPGTYCGGVHIFSGANVTLSPGVYVMNGGPFWVNGNSTVTGDKVMIAFTGDDSTLYLTGNSTITLTSPTMGVYMNMQFMQDRTQEVPHAGTGAEGVWFSVGGGNGDTTKLKYDGTAYLPTQNWWVYGNAVVDANSPSLAIVAGKIWTQGDATVNITTNNPRGLAVSAPPQLIASAKLIR